MVSDHCSALVWGQGLLSELPVSRAGVVMLLTPTLPRSQHPAINSTLGGDCRDWRHGAWREQRREQWLPGQYDQEPEASFQLRSFQNRVQSVSAYKLHAYNNEDSTFDDFPMNS